MRKFPLGTNEDDKLCARALIDAILASSETATISIDCEGCGEEFEIEDSRSKLGILKAMNASGEDFLTIKDNGKVMGVFHLIFNNGSEGWPEILISNHTSNDYCDSIADVVAKEMEPYTK